MSSEAEDLRQQIAELSLRVGELEARVGELSAERVAASRVDAAARHEAEVASTPPAGQMVPDGRDMGQAISTPRQTITDDAPARLPGELSGGGDVAQPERSLETRIGSQLFNRVGIVAVLIGAAWFLKLAIDNQWIGAAGRVLIGVIAGAALIAFSERFRVKGYRAFSYSLKAIATGVLYLSMWAGYALFHLIPGWAAFLAMVLITGTNALMCWTQNSEVLAFYAAVGGFLTPMLLSVHVRNELTLFSYLLVLDMAVVVLIALRPWPRLLLAAFAGTTFYAIGWYASDYSEQGFGLTLFFILAFFLLFAISPLLLRNLRLAAAARGEPLEESLTLRLLPAMNAMVGFIEIFLLMSTPGHLALRPWIALPFAAFYLFMLRVGSTEARDGATAPLPPIYLVLSVVFATLAIPMEAHGRWIAIGWFLEYAILLWFAAAKSMRPLLPVGGCVLALGVVALWLPLDFFNPPVAATVLVNARFATYLVAIAACLAGTWLALRAVDSDSPDRQEAWRTMAAASALTATVLLLVAVCLEIHAYWSGRGSGSGAVPGIRGNAIDEQFSYSAWLMLLGAALLAAGFWRRSAFLRWQALVLLAVSIAKVFLFDTQQLSQGYRILSFLGLGALLLTVSFAYQKDWLGLRGQTTR